MNILIVDDSKVMQKTLVKQVLSCGVPEENIQTADDGAQAVLMVRNTRPCFDLIIMDHDMPVMTGDAATLEIRALERTLDLKRSIIITCSTSVSSAFPQADGLLKKPVNKEELKALLESVERIHSRREEADEKTLEEGAPAYVPRGRFG